MIKKRLIPFKFLPASWGLTGKTRAIAEAEYYYTGEDLERALIPINFPEPADVGEATKAVLKLDLKYNRISELEYDDQMATMEATGEDDAKMRRLAAQLKHGVISITEFEKKQAEILQEPWVNIVKMEINPETATAGYVELDWNEHFVKMLSENGYTGRSDEDLVNKWFNDVCRTVLIQEMSDQDYGMQEQPRRRDKSDVITTNNRTESKSKISKTGPKPSNDD
jgi:hypothetical protein